MPTYIYFAWDSSGLSKMSSTDKINKLSLVAGMNEVITNYEKRICI